MRLVDRSTHTEFYESFSDLIFGTLVLFIVLVLALSLKLRAAIEDLEVAAEDVVSKVHFTGSANRTQAIVTAVPKGDALEMIWVPTSIVRAWDTRGADGAVSNAPLIALCELALRDGGFTRFPADALPKLGAAFSRPVAAGFAYSFTHGEAIYLIELRMQLGEPTLDNATAETLAAAVGTLEPDPDFPESNRLATHDPRLTAARAKYRAWSTDNGNQSVIWHVEHTATVIRENSDSFEHPRICMRTTGTAGRFDVGGLTLTSRQVGDILKAIKPGRGYYVELTDESGAAIEPPDWVFEELLVPAGYTERVLREEEG